jgi:hypothetical protein
MPRGKTKDRDGIYQRKLEAHTLQQARTLLSAEQARVDKTVTLGYAPPSAETFTAVSTRFLKHQQARLTSRAYTRESGIMEAQFRPFFGTVKLGWVKEGELKAPAGRTSNA